jgi:PAS domain S-box-containing protein
LTVTLLGVRIRKDGNKTKEQLINELTDLRVRIAELESLEAKRVQTEHALRVSEESYRSLVDLTPDIIYRLNEKGIIVFISSAVKHLGYEPDKLVGTPLSEIIHLDDRGKSDNRFVEYRVGNRRMQDMEVRLLTKEHRVQHYSLTYRTIKLSARGQWSVPDSEITRADKRFLYTQGIAHDITLRTQAEKKLKRYRERLEGLVKERTAALTIVNDRLHKEIAEHNRAKEERERLIVELQSALAKVKALSGMLPICSSCKKIRNDKGYWEQIEVYIRERSEADFSHGICPECMKSLYPEFCKE